MHLDTILHGLAITVVGMGLVFLALGLLVLAMQLMVRYLPPRPAAGGIPATPQPDRDERARVAAMAAAIILAAGQNQDHPSDAWRLAAGAGPASPWQAAHRTRSLAMPSNRGEGRRPCP